MSFIFPSTYNSLLKKFDDFNHLINDLNSGFDF